MFLKNGVNTDILENNYDEIVKNNKLMLKTQERFKSESHIMVTEHAHKIALSSNDDKKIQSIDSNKQRPNK